jgi:hypothetical protein
VPKQRCGVVDLASIGVPNRPSFEVSGQSGKGLGAGH